MEFEFKDTWNSVRIKMIKILVLNIVIWTLTFVGYEYMDILFASDFQGSGKIAAIVFMGPVFALYLSIKVGIEEQKIFTVSRNGLAYGGALSGIKHYPWPALSIFLLSPEKGYLDFKVRGESEAQQVSLNRFGIGKSELEKLNAMYNAVEQA